MRLKIDWASFILGTKFTVFLCFNLHLRAISKYKPPGGLTFGGAIQRRVFCVTSLGGLYMEGLIFGILRYLAMFPHLFLLRLKVFSTTLGHNAFYF